MRGRGSSIPLPEDSAKKRLYLKLVNATSDSQAVDTPTARAKLAPEGKLISFDRA